MPPRPGKKALAKKPSPSPKAKASMPAPAAAPDVSKAALSNVEEEVNIPEPEAETTTATDEFLAAEEAAAVMVDEEKAAAEETTPPAVAEGASALAAEEEGKAPNTEEMELIDVPATKVEDAEAGDSEAEELASPTEPKEVLSEVEISHDGASEMCIEEGSKQKSVEEVAAKVEDTDPCRTEGDDEVDDGGKGGSDDDSDNEEDEEEVDPSAYSHYRLMERRMNKDFEIFIGGLGKDAVEDDLVKVFSEYGEIQSARIVKHPVTQKSKGFAFIRYATVEQAEKVLAELKDGVEVKGKRVGVLPSLDNDTLYLGNICKNWSKDYLLESLKGLGVEQIEGILLPDDLENEGKNKGFSFLEFASHSDAMAAFQRLGKPDAIFGSDRSAKVAFAHTMLSNEEAKSQVKTVYLEGLPLSWDEDKVKELCEPYGEIEKIQVTRKFNKNKRKCLGFVAFISKESAVACMEGINNAQLGEEDVKVKADLAKPSRRGWRAKQGARGGFKIKDGEDTKEAGPLKSKGQAKSSVTQGRGDSSKGTKVRKSSKPLGKAGAKDRRQMEKSSRVGKRGAKDRDSFINGRPSKKARNERNFVDFGGRPSNAFNTRRKAHFRKPKADYAMHQTTHSSGYPALATGYHAYSYGGASGSKHLSDMEPHAGYIPTAKQGKRSQDPYRYAQRRVGGYDNQQNTVAGVYDNQQRIHTAGYSGIGAIDNHQRIGGGVYGNQQVIGAGGYDHQQRTSVSGYDNQQRMGTAYPSGIGPGAYGNQQRIGGAAYHNQQMIGAGEYENQQRIGASGYSYDNQQRAGAGYAGAGSVLQSSYPGHSSSAGYEAGYAYPNSGPYTPQGPYY